ncbi:MULTISPECIES: molybdopterin molybdotransferase MoeA [Methylotenera]|uniref:molybdopterin molybdotransferase MoeA n=1 Tax=Methylotenera TaxID=359407 RepID=UPI000365506A|nr:MULTISPECIES: gephyrin-like molybdotransferase Glp [Methylotenera]
MTKTTLTQIISDPSCMDDYDPNAMSVIQARAFIQQFLTPVIETEQLAVMHSLGRVLAADIVSPSNVPNHDNSAMDGYAFKFIDANERLTIIGTAFAGRPFEQEVNAGECVKIMTGAVIPKGADTVVMQERISLADGKITLTDATSITHGANVRLAGEDLQLDQTVLAKGHLLRPADLGLIASLGIGKVHVFRQLKVAFFSTGDELISVGKPLASGQIYDSNRYTLFGMLSRLGVVISDLGVVPDDPALLEFTLLKAASENDVVITSGGVSVGEADYMKDLLTKHGQVLFWKINMKPGRPLAYGKIGNNGREAHYFGLPGNPVATMVTFYQFVREALITLMGGAPKPLPLFNVECTEPIKKATGRTEFQRGILYMIEDGSWKVKPLANQSSGVLSSMSAANCFIVLDDTVGNCTSGEMVQVQLLEGLV